MVRAFRKPLQADTMGQDMNQTNGSNTSVKSSMKSVEVRQKPIPNTYLIIGIDYWSHN